MTQNEKKRRMTLSCNKKISALLYRITSNKDTFNIV